MLGLILVFVLNPMLFPPMIIFSSLKVRSRRPDRGTHEEVQVSVRISGF